MSSALEGLLVLDLTRYLPGPLGTLLLADFGAHVVKVEAPEGDPVRHFPPPSPDGTNAAFRALNAGKRSIALDLKNDAGRALLLDLVARADVLVEGFRPGVMDRMGLGWDACSARNPRLVYASITGYGQDGPYRDVAGHDLNYQALAGTLAANRDAVGAPVVPGVQVADVTGGLLATVGVLAALVARERTGRGERVDVAMLDAALAMRALQLVPALLTGEQAFASALLSGRAPCYAVYGTLDGRFGALGALEPKFWDAFCRAAGRPEWIGRGTELDSELSQDVQALFATRTLDEWRALLEPAGCCFTPVNGPAEVARDPHVRARGLILEDEAGKPIRVAPPVRLERTPATPALRAAARPGADTSEVLARHLDLDDQAVEALRAKGAFGASDR